MAIIATSPESSVETAPGATASVRSLIYVVLLASLAAYFLAWPIWRAQFLVEIWPTEGWNAYLQDAAASGRRLYPSADDLTGNNYPPLSFYAVGYLGKIFGDNLFVGRALSIVALFGVAGEMDMGQEPAAVGDRHIDDDRPRRHSFQVLAPHQIRGPCAGDEYRPDQQVGVAQAVEDVVAVAV